MGTIRTRRVTPLGLAAHRLNRQLRAAGSDVSLPDLHRAFDKEIRSEIVTATRQVGLAVLLFFVAIEGAVGSFRFTLGFVDMEAPILYIAFFAAVLLAGFTISCVQVALLVAYRMVVAGRIAGRRAFLPDLAAVLSGTASLGDLSVRGSTYLPNSARHRAALRLVSALLLLPAFIIYGVVLLGLCDLLAGVLFGPAEGIVNRLIALSGFLVVTYSFALLIFVCVPARLREDRAMLRSLLLLGIAVRERRIHPRYAAWQSGIVCGGDVEGRER